jgi:hypothetical protein
VPKGPAPWVAGSAMDEGGPPDQGVRGDHAPSSEEIDRAIDVLAGVAPREVQKRGYHFQRRDYYSALNDLEFLSDNRDLWQRRSMPRAIEWGFRDQLLVLARIAIHTNELHDVPFNRPSGGAVSYYWNNDFWRGVDAFVHYALLRHVKPERVVEIGCGWSSLLLERALDATEHETGLRAAVHQIEPYPRQEIMESLPTHWTCEQATLQRASLNSVEDLRAGDILFYDGSHVARTASDVNWFFFEVIPRVPQGVIIHVHDIFWPDDLSRDVDIRPWPNLERAVCAASVFDVQRRVRSSAHKCRPHQVSPDRAGGHVQRSRR